MYIAGRNEGFGMIPAYQLAEFIERHIGVVRGVSGKQRARKCVTGTQGIIQVEKLFPAFIKQ